MGYLDRYGPIRLVTFDLFHTLVDLVPSGWQTAIDVAGNMGIVIEPRDGLVASRHADDHFTAENGRRPIRDRTPEEVNEVRLGMSQRYFQALNIPMSPAILADFQARLASTLAGQDRTWVVFTEVLPVLTKLAAAGVMRAVISNADADVTELCLTQGFSRQMDLLVTSALVGWEKPDPRTFRAALDPLDVPPEQALHVGDQPLSDVIGARAIGMAAALLDRYDRHRADEHDALLVSILDELADIVIAHNQQVSAA